MTIDTDDLLNSILGSLERIAHVKSEEIPNIDLYMDQVTTFMDSHLKSSTRYPGEDKILTKTMINNYAKNDLLPPPVKKKYSKEHVLLLIFIYYFKGILSIGDIQSLLTPLTERFFDGGDGTGLSEIYDEVFGLEEDELMRLKEDVRIKFDASLHTFEGEKDRDFLQRFAFICMLSYDVYVKKLLIEKIIDGMQETEDGKSAKAPKEEEEKKEKAKRQK